MNMSKDERIQYLEGEVATLRNVCAVLQQQNTQLLQLIVPSQQYPPAPHQLPEIPTVHVASTLCSTPRVELFTATKPRPTITAPYRNSLPPQSDIPSKVPSLGWSRVVFPDDSNVLILSDSLLKSINPDFYREGTHIFSFSGLRSHELIEIIQPLKDNIKTNQIVVCVGTNDYYRLPVTNIIENIKVILNICQSFSKDVVLCTIPASLWRSKRHLPKTQHQLRQDRYALNYFIRDLAGQHVKLLDIEEIFWTHREAGKSCWYQADTLHLNTAGIIVLEKCLVDVLNDKSIRPPNAVRFDNDEVVKRRQFIRLNYSKTTISLRGSDCEDNTSAKRSCGIISSDSSEEETTPIWKRQK